jgi:hypothetical protein
VSIAGGTDNQALIATLSRVKAIFQLRAIAAVIGAPIVSHGGPLVVTSAGGSIPAPASDFLEAR